MNREDVANDLAVENNEILRGRLEQAEALLNDARQFTWDLLSPANLRLRIDEFLASQQGEHAKRAEQAEGAQGHGHVTPRADGFLARCGGPGICKVCQAEQARAALAQPSPAPELWAVHAQGPDDLYAAFSRDDAEKHAAELNALPMPEGITVGAVVVPSPWPAIEHWKYLAEQEREHNASLVAQAGQVPDSAASAKALVEIEAKKYSLNAAGMFNSGAPDHGQTIAVQELLAGFDDDEAEGHWEAIMAYSDLRASDALFHAAELLTAAPAQGG
ncbi:hypothetical protein N7414_01235 [Pseudomonas sp. GD04087]|uniref:hypothetical protein n=1 Tax=unclassified Pseudomonas TaxID=196821 RepID=UPI002448D25D|nr:MULTISPECIES: hypothetical protein [unclassified Pseudomonas]MDH0287722.1 hypothetical protein [Pseudomonas sp. GD04087]MDH1050853.1 hypothetical protein [Pseudomonas sp. GD03903]MDH1999826.1 hypothetical protein [Pseudomonas sp. GD03691]